MVLKMGLKEFYYRLEDKYFEMLDKLEEKGINLYKVVDPLEKKGIPTFPIFSIIILAIIALIVFLLVSKFTTGGSDQVQIAFFDNTEKKIADTTLEIKLNDISQAITTDEKGVAYLSGLNKEKMYQLKLDDPVYKFAGNIETYEIDPTKKTHAINLEKIEYQEAKTITFKKQSGDLFSEPIEVEFDCSNGVYTKQATVTDGVITLTDLPVDCGRLIVTISGRDDYLVNIPEDGTIGEVRFSEVTSNATLLVNVKDKDTSLNIPNVNVSIYDRTTEQLVDSGLTNQNGLFSSESVVVGKQYFALVSDPNSIYSSITKLEYETSIIPFFQITPGTNRKDLTLKRDVIGFIELRVKDKSTNSALEGVTVKLSRSGNLIDTRFTDLQGEVKFPIRENVPYTVRLDKPGYILFSQTISITTKPIDVSLIPLSETGNSPVNISVVDTENKPIEYATVKIWDALSNEVIKVVTTDIYGKVTVNNLNPEDVYFAEAISGKYTGKSTNFQVMDREIEDVSVVVNIGQGTYNLIIMDEGLNPISAVIKVFDAQTSKELTEKQAVSNENGLAILSIRADKTVFFGIEADTGLVLTKQYNVPAEATFVETIIIPSTVVNTANIEFIGFYNSNGETVSTVIPGQSQIARFVLNVDKKYSRVVAHIRTGQGDTCGSRTYSATEDSIYIKQVGFAGSKQIGSINYTPCLGESKDLSQNTTKNTKWVNLIIENPIVGSYLIDAEIVVTDTAGTHQSLYYRAEFQQGTSVLRKPSDSVLGTSSSSSSKQALYAYAKSLPVYVGDTSNCDDGVCYSFAFWEKGTSQYKRVVDKFSAKDGTDYTFKFMFNMLKGIGDASLALQVNGQTIKLNNFSVTSAGNQPISGEDFSDIPLGNLLPNDSVTGEVELSVVNDIADELAVELLSGGDVVFGKKILFDLKPSKSLSVEFLPKMVIPYMPNNAIIGVIDDTNAPVQSANVFVRINSTQLIDGKTDKDGFFAFIIPATNINDSIEVTVRKQGYKTQTLKYKVTESVIVSIPEAIELNIDLSNNYSATEELILMNNTILPFSITSAKTNINSEYVTLTSQATGMVLEPNSQAVLSLTARLTEDGIDLMTQKTLKGDLLIAVNTAELQKSWLVTIPITIRITFGQSVDNTDCLLIEPEETEIRLTETEYAYNLSVTNDCQVGGTPVALSKLYIESDYKETKKLGDFYVIVGGQEKKLSLDEKVLVLSNLDAEKKATVKLVYKMNTNTKGGVSTPVIRLSSNRASINGVDNIVTEHYPRIIINNYQSCVETPTTQIVVPYCAYPEIYNSVFGMSPYSSYSQNFNPLYYTSTQTGLPYSLGYQTTTYAPAYAQSSFYANFPYNYNMEYTQYYQGQAGMQYGCQPAQFQVKNSCYEDIVLKFDALAGVIIKSDSEIALKKGESKTVSIQGGQVLGEYKIGIYAKPADDAIDEFTFVKDLPVIVNRPLEILPNDCIVVPTTEFDFTSTTDVKKLTVINSCFDSGFALTGLKVLNIDMESVGDIQYFYIGDVNKELNPKKSYRYQDGKTIEIMTIGVRRNPDINPKALLADTSTMAKVITSLRRDYFDVSKAVTAEVLLGIDYSTPRLQKGELEEEIKFIDRLQWFGYIDENTGTGTGTGQGTGTGTGTGQGTGTGTGTGQGTGTGTGTGQGADIDTRRKIDYTPENTKEIETGAEGVIEFKEFELNDNSGAIGILLKVKDQYLDDKSDFFNNDTDARVCFVGRISDFKNADPIIFGKLTEKSYINKVEKSRIQNGEVIAELHFVDNGAKYRLCISRPLTPITAGDARFDRSVFRDETDTTREKIFKIMNPKWGIFKDTTAYNVKFALSANLGNFGYIEETNIPEYIKDSPKLGAGECLDPIGLEKVGATGTAYTLYGFDRLLFVWDAEDIAHNACDYGYTYCDQDQLRIAFSKKLDYISHGQYIELDGIKFLKADNKIAKANLLDKNPLNRQLIEKAVSSKTIPPNADTVAQINTLREIIGNVPEQLRKYTIIEIDIPIGKIEGFEPIDLTPEKIDSYTAKLAPANYAFGNETNKRYQFNVNTFLKATSNLTVEINGFTDEENKQFAEYLRRFLNTMTIYYGDTLTPVIINAKTYGGLSSGLTNEIFTNTQFMSNFWQLNLKSSSSVTAINTPGTYKIDLEITEQSKKKASYSVTAIDADMDAYGSSDYYKQNIFFTNPINANYYNYGGIPFKKAETGVRKDTEFINNFDNWAKVQDGYVLVISADQTISSISFKDIRPLQVISPIANDYRIDYLTQEKYSSLSENTKWIASTGTNKQILQVIKYTGKPTYAYLLLNYNNEPTAFKSTIFVFNKLADKSSLTHQLRIYSRNEFLFNVTPVPLQMTNISDNKAHGYAIPKDLSTLPEYSNKLSVDTATVKGMISGIEKEDMCFNFNNEIFRLWVNPAK